jgi:arylsulfatase A-like enzyme
VGQEAARWIAEYQGSKPFAMMVGFPGPHHPYDPTPEFARNFSPADMPEPIPEVKADTLLMRGKGRRSGRKAWYAYKNEGTPTVAHYMLQRAYYAALVKQIDDEVGSIVDALREKGILDDTAIIFSSDHGDYLGDHNLSGKNSFYEAAVRVPLLVRLPWSQGSTSYPGLASLSDVTATILSVAGCRVPTYVDCVPLPGVGLPGETSRDCIVGSLRQGWMLVRDEWKLARYAGGGSTLFDLHEDPTEQRNLAKKRRYADVFHRLDSELSTAIMSSIDVGHADKRVYRHTLSGSQAFGRPGWPRTYPTDLRTIER